MIELIKKYFLFGIIALLIVLLFISRCSQPKPDPPKPVIRIDTVLITHTDTIPGKPILIYTKPEDVPPIYLPDTNYAKLKKQYVDLLNLYFRKNAYKDTLRIDSTGFVYVIDTVARNNIKDRKFSYNLTIPTITKTITNPYIPRNQLYIGGAIQGTLVNPVNQINAGLLWKNKKDQMFGAYTGINVDGQMVIGVQSYWKIHVGK